MDWEVDVRIGDGVDLILPLLLLTPEKCMTSGDDGARAEEEGRMRFELVGCFLSVAGDNGLLLPRGRIAGELFDNATRAGPPPPPPEAPAAERGIADANVAGVRSTVVLRFKGGRWPFRPGLLVSIRACFVPIP